MADSPNGQILMMHPTSAASMPVSYVRVFPDGARVRPWAIRDRQCSDNTPFSTWVQPREITLRLAVTRWRTRAYAGRRASGSQALAAARREGWRKLRDGGYNGGYRKTRGGDHAMNGLFEAAGEVGAFLTERAWEYCIIGGLAVARWGEPRATLGADMTLLTAWGQ